MNIQKQFKSESRRWHRDRVREWEYQRAKEQLFARLLFLVFMAGVLALGMHHISSRM